MLGTAKTDDLGKYVGVPTIDDRVTKASYQEIITRVDCKLAGWKAKCLSTAGWAILIQATITAIPHETKLAASN